jgi:DNA-directed RNA polymerase specialized sigma24 family protein
MMLDDYDLELRIRNGRIRGRMLEAGYDSAAALSRAIGVSQGSIGDLINMKIPARRKNGEWRSTVVSIANALHCTPDDLFTTKQALGMDQNKWEASVSEHLLESANARQAAQLPAHVISSEHDLLDLLDRSLSELPSRYQYAIRSYYGIGEEKKSSSEIAAYLGVTRSRVSEMVQSAVGRLRQHKAGDAGYVSRCALWTAAEDLDWDVTIHDITLEEDDD